MKQKKTARFATITLVIAASLALAGCGQSKEAKELNAYLEANYSAPEEVGCPAPEELASALEEMGFEVERNEEVGELGIKTDRVTAVKDEQYLDICYGVTDEQEAADIMDYYIDNYDKCNIMNDGAAVFCYSSESVAEQAGLLAD